MYKRQTFSRIADANPTLHKDAVSSFDRLNEITAGEPYVGLRVDNSKELIAAAKMLKSVTQVNLELSIQYRSTSNSLVAYVIAYNCQYQPDLQGGNSPIMLRHPEMNVKHTELVPFGSRVWFRLNSEGETKWTKGRSGVVLGYYKHQDLSS